MSHYQRYPSAINTRKLQFTATAEIPDYLRDLTSKTVISKVGWSVRD